MSKTRTATLAVLGSALTASLLTAGSASAQGQWCEETAPYGCSRWSGTTQGPGSEPPAQPAGVTRDEYRVMIKAVLG